MDDFKGLVSKFNKFNRGLNKKKNKKKDIDNPRFLLNSLFDDVDLDSYQVLEQNISFRIVPKIDNQNENYAGESIPGEFYEPDSEILEAIGNKTGFSEKELSDRGICTPLYSLHRREARAKSIADKDPQLAKIEIENLRQKYNDCH